MNGAPFTLPAGMSRETAFARLREIRADLEAAQAAAARRLHAIPGVGSGLMGLTPDDVRLSPEYREALAAHQQAFTAVRKFNIWFVPAFKAELADERARRKGESR